MKLKIRGVLKKKSPNAATPFETPHEIKPTLGYDDTIF
jgi:hypothetical protein